MAHELKYEDVRPELKLHGATRAEPETAGSGLIGQERAARALEFGMNAEGSGFNVFVSGPTGIGKMELVEEYVRKVAAERSAPDDILFVHNHKDPYRPRLLMMPAGKGEHFAEAIRELQTFLEEELPRVFESDEYTERRDEAVRRFKQQGESASDDIQKKAQEYGFTMRQTLMGTALVPVKDGEPLGNEELQNLSEDEQKDIQRRKEELQQEIASTQKEYRKINREAQKRVDELDRQVVENYLEGPLEDLRDEYGEYDGVKDYLDAIKTDVQDNVEIVKQKNSQGQQVPPQVQQQLQAKQQQFFSRFDVNVAVDNAEEDGAPVIVERNPTYSNLVGTIEKEMTMGALTTDFTMVKAGSILKANGGFLLLPLEDLLRNPYGWDALKRALDSGRLQIEELQQQLGLMSVKTLKPQPVPLAAKIVLVGDPMLFKLLHAYDKGFRELFKVRADLDTRMRDDEANRSALVGALQRVAEEEELGRFSDEATARLVQHAIREAEHQKRLSVRMEALADVVRETAFWARRDGSEEVEMSHVEKALEQRVYRSAQVRDRILELVEDGTILISTTDRRAGQVNGLSVIAPGEISFGRPVRITASVGPGREGIVDIERKTELGGPIHNKGVLIITGFLARLAGNRPLGINAWVVFEQSYAPVEGDSASLAELIAIVSALAEKPLRQDVAITGSVNQHGDVQAIGGVNEKVEGFFDLCSALELSGDQGVIIPKSNVQNLMLRPDVAEAVRDGSFHLWSVERFGDAVEILSGESMGDVTEAFRERIDAMNAALRAVGGDLAGA
ncbi:MAG: Lon protease family protein [Spirochaetota bacterium]